MIVDIDDLSNYLHFSVLDDLAAELALELGNGVVREYCGWYLYPAVNEVLALDGDGSKLLKLPTMCLNAVNAVAVDGFVLDDTEYSWSSMGLLYHEAWSPGARNIIVDVDHGYSERPSGPALVALAIAAREYLNPERVMEASSGTVRRRYAFNELETRLLDPHRLP